LVVGGAQDEVGYERRQAIYGLAESCAAEGEVLEGRWEEVHLEIELALFTSKNKVNDGCGQVVHELVEFGAKFEVPKAGRKGRRINRLVESCSKLEIKKGIRQPGQWFVKVRPKREVSEGRKALWKRGVVSRAKGEVGERRREYVFQRLIKCSSKDEVRQGRGKGLWEILIKGRVRIECEVCERRWELRYGTVEGFTEHEVGERGREGRKGPGIMKVEGEVCEGRRESSRKGRYLAIEAKPEGKVGKCRWKIGYFLVKLGSKFEVR
jgi:hypothetical protein